MGVPSSRRSRRKTPRPEGTPLDLRLPHGKIVIILGCRLVTRRYVLGVCMGKIGQNPKIEQLWHPHSSATVRRTKSCHSLALRLQCLFDLISISDFGGKWLLKWKVSKMSFRILRRDTELRFVTKFGENRPLWSCQKIAWFTKQKKTWAPQDSSQPPFWPKWADRNQNSLNAVTPWPVYVYRIWSRSAAFCRTYSRKIDFAAQKFNTI